MQIGDDVEHPAFGEGVVIDLRGHGEEAEATVNFAGMGTKHLALAFAPLRKRQGGEPPVVSSERPIGAHRSPRSGQSRALGGHPGVGCIV